MRHLRLSIGLSALFALAFSLVSLPGIANARGQLDSGVYISPEATEPYESSQKITLTDGSATVFGMITDAVNGDADIYSFTASATGAQTIKFAVPSKTFTSSESATVIFLDPKAKNDGTEPRIPVPQDGKTYQSVIITDAEADPRSVNEPALFESFTETGNKRVELEGGETYYIVVLHDPMPKGATPLRYALRVGEGGYWTFADTFRQPLTWFQYKLMAYGGANLYGYSPATFGGHISLFGFAVWLGMVVILFVLSILSPRKPASGYVLVKLQPVARIAVPVAAWFTVLGAYLLFTRPNAVSGMAVATTLSVIPALIVLVVDAFVTSRKLASVELASREARIPKRLLAAVYTHSVITIVSLGAATAFVAMQLSR